MTLGALCGTPANFLAAATSGAFTLTIAGGDRFVVFHADTVRLAPPERHENG